MGPGSLRARDVMTTEVVAVPPDTPATALARLLADRGISAAPVADPDGRLLGIVTEADLLRRLAGAGDEPVGWLRRLFGDPQRDAGRYARTHGRAARDIMTAGNLATVDEDTPAERCARLMEERGVKRLPVLRDGRLVGVVSRADLLRAVMDPPAKLGAADGAEAAAARDARVRAALGKEMRAQPWTSGQYAFADVQDGVVTLHGFARSGEVRRGLRVLAERIEGVERVEDRMTDAPVVWPSQHL